MNEYDNPTFDRFQPADNITARAIGTVQGRTFVAFAEDETRGTVGVKTAAAGTLPAGVAAYDAADQQQLGVKRGNRVITIAVDSDIPVGTAVEVGANGKAAAHSSGTPIGTAYGKGDVPGTNLIAINL